MSLKHVLPVLFFALTLGACASTEAGDQTGMDQVAPTTDAAAGPINANCPIMGGEVDPDVATVDVNGHAVGFCCGGCDEKFNAWSDEEKTKFVEEALAQR